jgi:hypothetical protein
MPRYKLIKEIRYLGRVGKLLIPAHDCLNVRAEDAFYSDAFYQILFVKHYSLCLNCEEQGDPSSQMQM